MTIASLLLEKSERVIMTIPSPLLEKKQLVAMVIPFPLKEKEKNVMIMTIASSILEKERDDGHGQIILS